MVDRYSVAYGALLIIGGLFGLIKGGSIISFIMAVPLGAWSIRNGLNPTRTNKLANLGIAVVLFCIMLVRYLIGRKLFPAMFVAALSAGQIFLNYPVLNQPFGRCHSLLHHIVKQ